MTNREHIMKLIAGLDAVVLYDIYEDLPPEVQNREPIRSACELCPQRNEDGCYADDGECDKHIAAWMNMEVQSK